MPTPKLTNEACKRIAELLKEGYKPRELAEMYGVTLSTIYRRAKYPYSARFVPLDVKNKVIKKIKEGYTKAEAAQMYDIPLSTVLYFTKGLPSIKYEGGHIIRRNGIELLRRLMEDGCLISDFVVSTVRNLQRHFPMIKSARFKGKTIFYLKDREEDTIEAYFREKPDRVINYSAIEEFASLLGVTISREHRRRMVEKYKSGHYYYWKSRRLGQTTIDDWI